MTTEDREARLTAYALDDTGLTSADRREIETLLTTDPATRRAVEETRHARPTTHRRARGRTGGDAGRAGSHHSLSGADHADEQELGEAITSPPRPC